MRFLRVSLLLVVCLAIFCGCSGKQSEFKPLFNGKNLEGWYLKIRSGDNDLAKKVFTAENGMVHVFKDFPKEYELNTGGNATHGMMYADKEYSKFIFKFEYKWGKNSISNNFDRYQYDAGMYYHVVDDVIFPVGLEYQVRYNHVKDKNHTGDYWGKGFTWYTKDGKTFSLPSEGGKKLKKRGEHLALNGFKANGLNDQWNQCEVIVMGNQYSIHKLNGEIVNKATDLPYSKGKVGLQSETAEVFYRNIEIKEFDEIVPMEEFLK